MRKAAATRVLALFRRFFFNGLPALAGLWGISRRWIEPLVTQAPEQNRARCLNRKRSEDDNGLFHSFG